MSQLKVVDQSPSAQISVRRDVMPARGEAAVVVGLGAGPGDYRDSGSHPDGGRRRRRRPKLFDGYVDGRLSGETRAFDPIEADHWMASRRWQCATRNQCPAVNASSWGSTRRVVGLP